MRATRRPRCRSASAHRAPANPEPTIATSASTAERHEADTEAGSGCAVLAEHLRLMALLEVHGAQTRAARVEAARTVGEPLEIPEVGEDAHRRAVAARESMRERKASLEVVETRRPERSFLGQRFERAVSRSASG